MPDGFDNTAQPGGQFAFLPAAGDAWKQEVASRLDRYRTRRKRSAPEASMRLNFDPLAPIETSEPEAIPLQAPPMAQDGTSRMRRGHVPAALRNLPPEPGLGEQDAPEETLPSVGESQAVVAHEASGSERQDNVLQFPRSALNPVFCEELAEPVQLKPRILDVPEELAMQPVAIVDLGLMPMHDLAPDELELELPLPVAPLESRALASLVDALIVLCGGGLFLGLLGRWGIQLSVSKLGIGMAIGSTLLFWMIYQYLFMVYSGGTPGMQATSMELTAFGGERVSRSGRKWRALGMLFSYCPLGLGLAWALVDEDGLCWHDRISHSYLRMDAPEHPISAGASGASSME
jgi:uncharacterized RDD family membrane protein YckC